VHDCIDQALYIAQKLKRLYGGNLFLNLRTYNKFHIAYTYKIIISDILTVITIVIVNVCLIYMYFFNNLHIILRKKSGPPPANIPSCSPDRSSIYYFRRDTVL